MKTILVFLSTFLFALAADVPFENRLFSADVYSEAIPEDENFIISPFSLETALALTQSGGLAATSEEIRSTLRLPETEEETEKVIRRLLPQLHSENYTLQSANRIYVKEDYEIREEFKKVARDVYQSGIENIEFSESVKAAKTINEWVEKQTQNQIHDLVSPKDLDANSRLILINALYFQATWKEPFAEAYTMKNKFYLSAEKSIDTDVMLQVSIKHKYYESKKLDAKFLELPLEGDASVTFVLPNQKEGLSNLEKQRSRILETPQYITDDVYVMIPKFKVETTIDFNEVLQKLGVRQAFSPAEADFSGIAGKKGDLYIHKVLQKSFISIDENGVEAAAATSIDVPTLSLSPYEFIADHPFLFYIKVKDVILFEGRVVKPTY